MMMAVWKFAPAPSRPGQHDRSQAVATPRPVTLLAGRARVAEFFPPGVLNVVCGDRDTGAALVSHPAPAAGVDHRIDRAGMAVRDGRERRTSSGRTSNSAARRRSSSSTTPTSTRRPRHRRRRVTSTPARTAPRPPASSPRRHLRRVRRGLTARGGRDKTGYHPPTRTRATARSTTQPAGARSPAWFDRPPITPLAGHRPAAAVAATGLFLRADRRADAAAAATSRSRTEVFGPVHHGAAVHRRGRGARRWANDSATARLIGLDLDASPPCEPPPGWTSAACGSTPISR